VQIKNTSLPGVLLIEPKVHGDHRGYFFESYRTDVLAAHGVPAFVQDNQSFSKEGTLRGLHFQLDRPQGKLVRVLRGSIVDVAVDIRVGSPTFGKWIAETLSADNHRQLYVPPGFAHGFCVVGDVAEVLYKCTDFYSGAADQRGVLWNDPGLAIAWPAAAPTLSDQDKRFLPLDPGRSDLPRYAAP
jgi:dTDP-4-dehydrorhamnose 3,5-epimerase